MANSKTSLNGYEYGRNPKTTAPFWAGSGEGAEIDDTAVVTDKTWSSKKISDELAEKADADDVYTKAQVDELLAEIPAVDAYTKTETDELLAGKAAVTSVYTKAQTYTKSEVDNLLSQIPAVDAYTKAQTDSLLADKANASDVYTKSQVDNLIPDVSGLATKTELTSGLASKADADDVYTKTYLDSEFQGISHAFSDVRDQIDTCAKSTSVYTKAQTYTKAEVDDLISGATPAPVDAYTKAQTDSLLAAKADVTELADYAKTTSVYTKAQTYTKAEVDNLIEGATPAPVDAYTKAQTDSLLDDKADASTVYTKAQTDNLLADKADVTDLADYAKVTSVYTKAQTYTKTEVDDLISQAGGGGAEIDDTSVAANKVWSSDKTRAELLKASGLQYTSYISTKMSLIRAKIAGSNSNTQNAMTEEFSANYQYSLSGATLSVTIMYADGSAGQTATINLTDIPWNELASAEYTVNYPDDNARWKRIVASEDIFEVCIAGNVSGTSGYYYPYIFVRVPKGTYTASISLSTNLKYAKWTKAGSVSVINGYVNDVSVPVFTKDITSMVVTDQSPAATIFESVFGELVTKFKRNTATIAKLNRMSIEATKTDLNGNTIRFVGNWRINDILSTMPRNATYDTTISEMVMEYDRHDGDKWIYNYSSYPVLTHMAYNIPSSNGNITGHQSSDSSSDLATVLFGMTTSYSSWTLSFYQ